MAGTIPNEIIRWEWEEKPHVVVHHIRLRNSKSNRRRMERTHFVVHFFYLIYFFPFILSCPFHLFSERLTSPNVFACFLFIFVFSVWKWNLNKNLSFIENRLDFSFFLFSFRFHSLEEDSLRWYRLSFLLSDTTNIVSDLLTYVWRTVRRTSSDSDYSPTMLRQGYKIASPVQSVVAHYILTSINCCMSE